MLIPPDFHTLAGRESGLQRDFGGHMVKQSPLQPGFSTDFTELLPLLSDPLSPCSPSKARDRMKLENIGKYSDDARDCRI